MKKYNYLIFAFFALIFVFIVGNVSASSQVISCNYNFSNGSASTCKYNPGAYPPTAASTHFTLSAPSFQLIVKPMGENMTTCNYTSASGVYGLGFVGDDTFQRTIGSFTSDGLHNYYISCYNSTLNYSSHPYVLHLQVNVDLPVTASIEFPDVNTSMLPAGRAYLVLKTSKVVQPNTVSLYYSFDGTNFKNQLPLFELGTSGEEWYSYLTIPSGTSNGQVYFQFGAQDLEGQSGNQITNGGTFPIDTVKPPMITDIVASSAAGYITLNWNLDSSNIYRYNIYRSNSPGVQYTDYETYVGGNQNYFTDAVPKGQTYYYRVAAVDEAGNIADLSKEVSSTSLMNNETNLTSGLAPQLLGQVQNFIVSADSVISNVNNIKSSFNNKSKTEQQLFSELGFEGQLNQAVSQIQSIERDANTLKLQDLTQQELIAQLNSLNLKLSVAEKQIPESITILNQSSNSYIPSSNNVSQALLEYNSSLSQNQVSRAVRDTTDYIKSSNLKIESDYYNLQVVYFDGSTNEISVVSRQILGQVTKMDNAYFIETVPKSVATTSSDLNVQLGSYNVVQSDPVLSFPTDTKNILYYIQGSQSISSLENTNLAIILLSKGASTSTLTGNSILTGSGTTVYGGIGIAVLIAVALMIYFLFLRGRLSDSGKEMLQSIENAGTDIKEDSEEMKKLYLELKEKYKGLKPREKKILYGPLSEIHKKIIGGKDENK